MPDEHALVVHAYEAPVGPIEVAIAQLWQQLLGVERVGRNDDFFDLGGDSLLAIRLIAQCEAATGRSCSVRSMLQEPTLAGLAAVLVKEGRIGMAG